MKFFELPFIVNSIPAAKNIFELRKNLTAFAYRLLTTAEQNYSKIEKETLLIVLSCEKFHEYVYGLRFVVENDHKPLISIFQRALSKSPPRTRFPLL